MHVKHVGAAALEALLHEPRAAVIAAKPVLDSADKAKYKVEGEEVMDSASVYAGTDLSLKAVAALQEWAETSAEDLDDGEGLGDRLFGLMVGIIDADMDGEISAEEADLLASVSEAAWDYLSVKGVPEDDISALLEDFDNEAAGRVQELLAERLPDGEEAAAAEMDDFVFGDGSDESALDAVYKKKIVVRKGKKMRVNKRVSGTVRLSAKQKLAVRKMLRKSHSAKAQMRRAKSMRVRKSMA